MWSVTRTLSRPQSWSDLLPRLSFAHTPASIPFVLVVSSMVRQHFNFHFPVSVNRHMITLILRQVFFQDGFSGFPVIS